MNSLSFVGNLVKDSILKDTSKSSYLLFTTACKVGYGKNEQKIWMECIIWGERALKLNTFLTKGTKVFIVGEMSLNPYISKTGEAACSVKVNVKEVEFISCNSKKKEDNNPDQLKIYSELAGNNAHSSNDYIKKDDEFMDEIPF